MKFTKILNMNNSNKVYLCNYDIILEYICYLFTERLRPGEPRLCSLYGDLHIGWPVMEYWKLRMYVAGWWPSGIRQTTIKRFPLEISQQIHMQLVNKSSHVLIVSKTNVHDNDTSYLINFTMYLFLCVKFSWIHLTLKIYYRCKFPDYSI